MARLVVALFGALWLIGCYAINQGRFNAYTARLIHIPMESFAAKSALASSGFMCDERSAYPEVTCTRNRTRFLSGCIERVNLTLNASRETVTAVDSRPIMCASF
jgi:hypothetical protein